MAGRVRACLSIGVFLVLACFVSARAPQDAGPTGTTCGTPLPFCGEPPTGGGAPEVIYRQSRIARAPNACGPCGSERVTYGACRALQRPQWTSVFEFPRFDPALGDLVGVDFSACFVLDSDICIVNASTTQCLFTASYNLLGMAALLPGSTALPAQLSPTWMELNGTELTAGTIPTQAGETWTEASVEKAFCSSCESAPDSLPGAIKCSEHPYPDALPLTDPEILAWFEEQPGPSGKSFGVEVQTAQVQVTITGCATFLVDAMVRLGATLEVTYIYCPNAQPVCMDDFAEACENPPGGTGSVDVCVLENDYDPDGYLDCFSLRVDRDPEHGSTGLVGCDSEECDATCPRGCRIRYQPNEGFTGCDTFTYTIADDEGCEATCTVRVCVNPLPSAADDTCNVCDRTPVVIDVLANDTTPDAETGECGCLPSSPDCTRLEIVTAPETGNAGVTQDCKIWYSPEPGACPIAVLFTYRYWTDRGCPSPTATVTVNVHCGPDAMEDKVSITANAPYVDIYALANDLPPTDGYIDCTRTCILDGCSPSANCGSGPWPTARGGSVEILGCTGMDCCQAPGCREGTSTCYFRYTPPVGGLSGEDSFCYRIYRDPIAPTVNCETGRATECFDSATVRITGDCLKKTQRRPSALLIYPEFDNRPGAKTLVTVTNTNQDHSTGVHFQYVEKEGCTRFDRLECLTSNDTLSLLTSAHDPNADQGYLYVYATCCPDGKGSQPTPLPIAFDYLIGQLFVVDGVQTLSYSVNPIEFCSGPGTPTTSDCPLFPGTDVDGDGIRDLNGIEYEPAPDALLIPRFYGQKGPASVASWIILIGLSGGKEFTTTLDVAIYNDNEVAFSALPSFHCWEKLPLWELSGGTLNEYLQSATDDDPLEILGDPQQEAGWIRIDGLTADSSTTGIEDPAFYAVLIECYGGDRCVADLPFELCTQTNGDLLPVGLEGDPVPESE